MKKLFSLIVGIFIFIATQNISAAGTSIGLGYTQMRPLPTLSHRFEPTYGLTYEISFPKDESTEWALFYRGVTFDKINTREMYFDTLRMSLKMQSLALDYKYSPLKFGQFAKIYLSAGAGLNRWYYHRDAFTAMDSTDAGYENIDAQEFSRDDWSWSGRLGVALDIKPMQLLTIGAAVHYELVVAELWPATKLRLNSVSGLHFLEPRAYIRFTIPNF